MATVQGRLEHVRISIRRLEKSSRLMGHILNTYYVLQHFYLYPVLRLCVFFVTDTMQLHCHISTPSPKVNLVHYVMTDQHVEFINKLLRRSVYKHSVKM